MKSFRVLTALAFAGMVMSQAPVTPQSFAASSFDVVIVGGGTAGLVLANRLSAQQLRVGVVDAGSYNASGDPVIDMPYGASTYLQNPNATIFGNPKYDWAFVSAPQAALGGRVIHYPRGKVLGGSSAINSMAWQRGTNADYDAWSTIFGNDGWNWGSFFPYFKRVANWSSPINSPLLVPGTTPADFDFLASVQGLNGHIHARYNTFHAELDSLLAETTANLGYQYNINPDDGELLYLPLAGIANSVDISTGRRSYAAPGYYNATVRARENLSVLTGAVASRIIWDNSTIGSGNMKATGVEYIVNGTTYVVNAGREVILSAGTLKTSQVLELSGVGNKTILQNAGVPVVLDFPEIGENLQDQPLVSIDYLVKDGVLTLDWLTSNQTFYNEQKQLYDTTHSGAFSWVPNLIGTWPIQSLMSPANYATLRASLRNTINSMELTPLQTAQYNLILQMADSGAPFVQPAYLLHGGVAGPAQPNSSYETVAFWLLHEFSRGSVHINSSNPQAPPVIDPKFMSFDFDLAVTAAASQFFDNMTLSQPFGSQVQSRNTPNSSVQTTSQWEQYVRGALGTVNHPLGATPMAARELGGVVDSRLYVYGLANVRIVDAGVIPMTLAVPPQQTVYSIAERASDMILEDLLQQ